MDQFEPLLVVKKEIRFSECLSESTRCSPGENFGDVFGGIIKSGQWGWITKGSRLCITSLRTGQLISKYDFDATNGFGVCIITCISEIRMPYLKDTIIAIGIQYADSPGGLVVLYSIEESNVIRCIDLKHKITCCKFISHTVSQHTMLQNMNGCLAVGTDGGSVLLLDLNLTSDEIQTSSSDSEISVIPCHIVAYSMSLLHLHRHFQHCQQEGVHFGIELEVLENAEFIQSLLPIDLILGLAVGLADGRLVLYDLTDMQLFHVTLPQEQSSPLVKMSYMEPPDDPRPCLYIWAFHENYQNSMAVMHSLMYEKRIVTDDGFCYFENFQVSSIRLQLPLNCPKSVPIACQAITKAPSHGNEETISLCALVWKQEQETQTEVLLFDINQWYKEEMPYVGDWRDDPSYLASFVLPGVSSLEMYFNPNTISLFNSIQRPEEHFYPISLSFDSIALVENSCMHLNWPGIQNRVIDVLRSQGSLALLDPNPVFVEILNARLLPQFIGLNYKAAFSLKAKRETLLSVAIENNCNGLLKECAKNWSDGSHQGNSLSEGLALSTLTDWLWNRASNIKERCNKICKVLFDHSGFILDLREKKELAYISKQLRTLADLSRDIISKFGENIPSDVLGTLESQCKSIRMASDYQEVLMWLLNIGLLPEASRLRSHREVELNLVPYPHASLQNFYEKRRTEFMRYTSRKTKSCPLLFIDSFLEHTFEGNSLRDSWQESGGDGLYPPASIQAMLRTMLITDVSFEKKCALFLYFFLDLNMAIEDKRYEPIVQNFIKFPSVFKLSASLIKQIQAFWNLDHCHFQAAVGEFISPFNKDQVCPQWQIELFIASLLDQMEANLALRVLEAKSLPISPILQLNTYLANDLISEAFHFARSERDEELLKLFFTRCLMMKKYGVIRDLALTESEGKLVQTLLKNSKNRNTEDLNFVYLLQQSKYIEAVSYQEELFKERDIQRAVDDLSKRRNNQAAVDIDTPSLLLSAYHTTMTPVTKNLSDVYLKIKNRIKNKETEQESPYPLSCQLIKQNANDLLGGIYHSSALSTHFASHYWEPQQLREGNALQQYNNAPFLRSPQISFSFSEYIPKATVSYPEPYKAAQKRRLDSSVIEIAEKGSKTRENPKKRRKIYDCYDFEQSNSDKLLTHFKNSTSFNSNSSSVTKKMQKTPSRDNSFFLETPFVKNTPAADNSNNFVSDKLGNSLPGILKVSNPKSSIDETDHARAFSEEPEKKKDVEEEKSIRFVLPLNESLEQIAEKDVSVESEDSQRQSLDGNQEPTRVFAGPAKRKSLRTSTTYTPISTISISKNELQSILDKVKYEQSRTEPTSKTEISVEESFGSTEAKKNLKDSPFKEKSVSELESVGFKSFSNKTTVEPEALPNIAVPTWFSTEESSIKTQEPIQKPHHDSSLHDQLEKITKSENQSSVMFQVPKRAHSASSEEHSNESNQRHRKQLRGRAPIHSSSEDTADYKTPKVPEVDTSTRAILDRAKTIFGTETAIDFQPRTSSSKVCATESKFTIQRNESESISKFQSEQITSKITFSERSTVVGGLSYMPTLDTTQNLTETISVTLQPKQQMLDTTVGMSMYDTMGMEVNPSESQSNESSKSVVTSGDSKEEEDDEEEETDSESNDFNEKANDNDEGSSVIVLSSRSSSRNDGTPSPQLKRNEKQIKRHISIDDDVEEDDDYDDDDDEDEMESFDDKNDSIDIIESDASDNISCHSFRGVEYSSTSCSLASHVESIQSSCVDEDSSNFNRLLKRTISGQHYGESSTESQKKQSDEKETHVPVKEPEHHDESSKTSKNDIQLVVNSAIEAVAIHTKSNEKESIFEEEEEEEKVESAPKRFKLNDDISEVSENVGLPPASSIAHEEKMEIVSSIAHEEKMEIKETPLEEHQDEVQSAKDKNKDECAVQEKVADMQTEEIVDLADVSKAQEQSENIVKPSEVANDEVVEIVDDKKTQNECENIVTPSEVANNETEEIVSVADDKETQVQNENTVKPAEIEEEIKTISAEVEETAEETVTSSDQNQDTPTAEQNDTEVPSVGAITQPDVPVIDVQKEIEVTAPITETVVLETVVSTTNVEETKIAESETTINLDDTVSEDTTHDVSTEINSQTTLEDTTHNVSNEISLETSGMDSTPNLRNRRSKSFSKTLVVPEPEAVASPRTRRSSRSGSMPPSTGSQIVTRRRSLLLETLDENMTPDSPSARTRSKLRSESVEKETDSPSVSNVKRSRLSSISSITSVDQPLTPKSRRRSSISMDKELSNTPKAIGTPRSIRGRSITAEVTTTPRRTPRRLSISKTEESPPEKNTPAKSSTKIPKKEPSESPEGEPEFPQNDDYTTSRRLTRTQMAVMEKSAALAKQIAMSPIGYRRRVSTTQQSPPTHDVKGSDNESNSSRISHLSGSTTSRRITRSLALREGISDDLISIASSTESNRKKRKRAKEPISPLAALKAIPEEGPSGSEKSVSTSEINQKTPRQKK